MKTKFDNFLIENDNDPFYSHKLRMKQGYRPKYRSGLIAVRFQDDERSIGKKYQDVDEETGELKVDYHKLFNDKEKSGFVKYFEDKYGIKRSDYRNGTDDYFVYFKCEQGKEKEKIEEIAKDKVVKVVDYVDVRELETGQELEEIGEEMVDFAVGLSENSDEEIKKTIENYIERLKKLL